MPVEKCSIRPSLQLRRRRPVRRLTDFLRRTPRKLGKVQKKGCRHPQSRPAVFDTAHVGFVFADVIRDGHCGARTCMASPSMRRRGPWAMPDARASWHLLANQTLFEVSLCRPTAPGLPIWGTGDFGTSPIFWQLSDKPLLACVYLFGVSERKAQWRIGTLMRRGSGFFCAGVVARVRRRKTRRRPL